MKIAFVLSFIPNPRMNRRIDLLKKSNNISLIYWNRTLEEHTIVHEDIKTYEIKIKSNFGSPLKRLSQTRDFSRLAYSYLEDLKPDIIYVQGLDMLSIACSYKKRNNNVNIIYEIADLNTLIIDNQKSIIKKVVRSILVKQEKKLIKKVSRLVITSEKFYDTYYNKLITKDKVIYIPNIPDLSNFKDFKKQVNDKFTVGFIGSVRYEKQLKMLIDAAGICNINVFIAGSSNKDEIKEYCKDKSNIFYFGPYDYKTQVSSLYSRVDAIYSVYDAGMTNVSVALPNRLYEGIYCELPIIASLNTYLGEIVEDLGVGVCINHLELNSLIDGLNRLANDKDYYNSLVSNCIKNKDLINPEMYNKNLIDFINKL